MDSVLSVCMRSAVSTDGRTEFGVARCINTASWGWSATIFSLFWYMYIVNTV